MRLSTFSCASTLALPIYPELAVAQQQRVVDAVVAYYQAAGALARSRVA